MKILLFLLTLLMAAPAIADTPDYNFQWLFNRLPGQPLARKYQLGTKLGEMHDQIVCVYDFATSGGTGTVVLKSTDLTTPCGIPGKAVVTNVWTDTSTAVLPVTASIAIQTHGASTDLMAAKGASASFGANTREIGTPVWATKSTWVKLGSVPAISGGVVPLITIDSVLTGTVTAGHFRVYINYGQGE